MKTIEQLYTKKTSFYHHFFIDALGYGKGLEKFFENYSYLKENIKILDAGCGTGIIITLLRKPMYCFSTNNFLKIGRTMTLSFPPQCLNTYQKIKYDRQFVISVVYLKKMALF